MRFEMIALALALTGPVSPARTPPGLPLSDLKKWMVRGGEWVSLAVELRPQEDRRGTGKIQPFYVTRSFRFAKEDRFVGTITSYGDPYGKLPLAKFEFRGHVAWQGEHPITPGAQKIDYILDEGFRVTPLHPQFAEQLNQAPVAGISKWEVGRTQDILKKAFPLFNIQEGQIVKDFDLVLVRDGMLFMGAKHVDGTPFDKVENRPTNLQVPLVRRR